MNIFIEGLQGMGKTTLLQRISQKLPQYRVYREGDYCPVELAWCSYMSEEEYASAVKIYPSLTEEIHQWTTREQERYIVAYTRIITDEPGFHKYMEQFEIYNGRKTAHEFQCIILERFRNLPAEKTGNLFECAFFQNIIEELILFHQMSDSQICSFYRELFDIVSEKEFRLYYLYGEDVEKTTMHIRKERCDENGNEIWYQMMMQYLQDAPYGRAHGIYGFDDMLEHFRRRQELEMRIIKEILGECAVVLPA